MQTALSLGENEKSLLTLIQSNQVPSYRQAYSDRTAWLMACLSELVYQPFGSVDAESTKKLLNDKLTDLLQIGSDTKEKLNELVMSIHKNDYIATRRIIDELGDYNIIVEETYDRDDTQAFLVSTSNYIALVFRGTEANSFKDIKTDINAKKTECVSSGGVHSGFSKAFEAVVVKIQNDINREEFSNRPLFIAGHSLGGALATIASKRLQHRGGIAACYTFGSPRVGDEKWSYGMKTPIYRVVNAVDCVTMLPPSGDLVGALKFVVGCLPRIGRFLQRLLSNFEGYFHVGDERFLTDCKPNKYQNVELMPKVSNWRRLYIFFKRKCVRKFVKDHSISVYRKKLAVIALRNNESA